MNFQNGSLTRDLCCGSGECCDKCCPSRTPMSLSGDTDTSTVFEGNRPMSHPEDSGYESPASKAEENQEVERSPFIPRAVSAPRPSRIPVIDSSTKFRFKRSSDSSTGSDGPLRLIHPPHSLSNSRESFSDQSESGSQSLTEERFLRMSRSQGQGQASFHAFQSSLQQRCTVAGLSPRCHSKSVPSMQNRRNQNEDAESLNKMVPPRYNIRPPSPDLCSSGQFPVTSPIQLPSLSSMLKSSDSFKALQTLVDLNVHEILNDGQKEFSGKYSAWIQQVFNLQLEKIHGRLKAAYTEKLGESLAAKKAEVLEIKSSYRTKLLEFESATKKFQEWYDDVLEENRKQLEANQKLLDQLLEKEASLHKNHEAQLQAQLIELRAEAEKERCLDLQRHSQQLKEVTDKTEAHKQLLIDQYQHQMSSLKVQLETLQKANVALQQKYVALRSDLPKSGNHVNESATDHEALGDLERHELKRQIELLETQIADMEKKNKVIATAHAKEVDTLHKTLDENNQKLRQLIKETRLNAFSCRSEREQGIREMQATILGKEAEYKKRLSSLTERYGKKIEDLTNSVQILRSQLLSQCQEVNCPYGNSRSIDPLSKGQLSQCQ